MRLTTFSILFPLSIAVSSAAQSRQDLVLAQKQEKAQKLTADEVSKGEQRVLWLETVRFPLNIFEKGFHGIRPLIGGMPSGSGTVAGIGYLRGRDDELVKLEANARYSTRSFTELDGYAEIPTSRYGSLLRSRLSAEYHDYTSLSYFGLGNDSNEDGRSYYRDIQSQFGAEVEVNLGSHLQIGAGGRWLRVDVGEADRSPSLGGLFDATRIPGFVGDRAEFAAFGGKIALDWLDSEIPAAGMVAELDVAHFDDRDQNIYGFTRYVVDVKGYVPLGYRNRYVALRFRTASSLADAGQRVPFYLMETIGGAKTIRGFSEYRFRDIRNLLLSAEYRWEVWTYLDFVVFFDAGKVFSTSDDFDFSGLHEGYGFGARFHAPKNLVLRFDVARSREGTRLHIGAGPSF